MFEQFRKVFLPYPVISMQEIRKAFPDFEFKNLVYWQKRGYLTKIRNGYYIFNETELNEEKLFQIANCIYNPSYVSLESALAYYGLIPETVYRIQSISTRKTMSFTSAAGRFDYHCLKPSLFWGYRLIREKKVFFQLASLEKAMLDFLYLRSDIRDEEDLNGLRWNQAVLATADQEKLETGLGLFKSRTMEKKVQLLSQFIHA